MEDQGRGGKKSRSNRLIAQLSQTRLRRYLVLDSPAAGKKTAGLIEKETKAYKIYADFQ